MTLRKKKNPPVYIRFKADQEQGHIVGIYLKAQEQYENLTISQFNQLPESPNTPQYKESVERMDIIAVSSVLPEPILLDKISADFTEINSIGKRTGYEFIRTIYCRYDWPINGLTSAYEIFYGNKEKEFVYRHLDIAATGTDQTEITLSETDIAFFFKTEGTLRWRHPAGFIDNPWWPPFVWGVDNNTEYNQNFLNELPPDPNVINWSLSYCYLYNGSYWIIAQDWNDPPEGENAKVIITGKYVIPQNQYTPPISLTPVYPLNRERIKTTKTLNLSINVNEDKYKKEIIPVTETVWTDSFYQPPSFFYDLYFKWGALPVLNESAGEVVIFDEQPPEEYSKDYWVNLSEHKAIFKIEEESGENNANSFIKMIDEKGEHQLPYILNETTPGTDYIKVISQSEGYSWPIRENLFFNDTMGRQLYFSLRQVETGGYGTSEVKPMIMKKNDDYMFMISAWDKCLIWKEGVEYVLPAEGSFDVNGIVHPVEDKWRWNISDNVEGGIDAPQFADYCSYFQDFGMCSLYLVEGEEANYKWVNWTYEEWNSHVYYFNVASWYGDYIYKVRVDEFSDGTFFRDELIKNNYPLNILEVIQKEIKKDLKIYRPETTSLWVEKYKVTLDGDTLTAKIEYVRRFKVPFSPPVTEEIALLQPELKGPTNNDSVNHITQLRDIFYIP
jgi:hypothetical protein